MDDQMTRLPDDQKRYSRHAPVIGSSGHLVIIFIRLYQWCLSPWLGACCRFNPSCSHYAVEAITLHGVIKGGLLATRRLLRCHPFGLNGYDPVPPVKN